MPRSVELHLGGGSQQPCQDRVSCYIHPNPKKIPPESPRLCMVVSGGSILGWLGHPCPLPGTRWSHRPMQSPPYVANAGPSFQIRSQDPLTLLNKSTTCKHHVLKKNSIIFPSFYVCADLLNELHSWLCFC